MKIKVFIKEGDNTEVMDVNVRKELWLSFWNQGEGICPHFMKHLREKLNIPDLPLVHKYSGYREELMQFEVPAEQTDREV